MNVLVFDTETISTNKPFCYNLGYMIMDFDTLDILEYEDFVIEQIYHNKPLFETAYYTQKKPIYTSSDYPKHLIASDLSNLTYSLMVNSIQKNRAFFK